MNLIGISGKIKSGKNTLAHIIQYLNSPIQQELNIPYNNDIDYTYNSSQWEQKSFATKLKQILSILTGINFEELETQEGKSKYLEKEWWVYKNLDLKKYITQNEYNNLIDSKKSYYELYKPTYREYLQMIGTDLFREQLHPDVWINSLFCDYKPIDKDKKYPSWIINDVRFINEANKIKELGGIVIRINRERICECGNETMKESKLDKGFYFCSCQKTYREHKSENDLDNYNFDYVINNNSTIDNLIIETKNMLDFFSI
jgi:hypothetical protein